MNAFLLSCCLTASLPGQPPPAPGWELLLPTPAPAAAPQPALIVPSPAPRIPTLSEFVATFVPAPGIHDVTIIHPVTKKPVNVVFRLPNEPLRKTHHGKTRISFDFGKTEVTLIFRLIGGKVDVRYD